MLGLTLDGWRCSVRGAAGLLVAVLAVTAGAQDTPFVGVVVEDDVPVRAGASPAYYVVGELDRGDQVKVLEILYGWNRIAAPEGFHSYVSKSYVDVRGDGKIGVINKDATAVKTGSVKGPGESYRTQVMLNRGDQVQIVGEEGSFYRIVPPGDASVYVRPGAIQRAEQAMQPAREPAQPQPTPAPAPQPRQPQQAQPQPTPPTPAPQPQPQQQAAAVPDVEYAVPIDVDGGADADVTDDVQATAPVDVTAIDPSQMVPAGTEEPATSIDTATAEASAQPDGQTVTDTVAQTAGQVQAQATDTAQTATAAAEGGKGLGGDAVNSPAKSPQLRALEARAIPEMLKPLEQQPIAELLQQYQQLQQDATLPEIDRQIIALRIAALQRNQQLAQVLEQIAAAKQESDRRVQERRPVEDFQGPPRYDFTGQLMASSVYNGVNLPLMYRLVDTATGRTLAYVRPDDAVQARTLLGRTVGVTGRTIYDPVLKLNIVNVQAIEPVTGPGSATPPAVGL